MDNVEPTDKQFYDYIVGHLKREHGLANSRMTWMLTSQGFLFTAFGVINSKTASLEPDLLQALRVAIPSVGLTVSVAALIGILGTNAAVSYYRNAWDSKHEKVWTRFPLPSGDKIPHALGLFSTLIIPLIICFAWLLVVCKKDVLVFWIAILAILILSGYLVWDARKIKSPDRKKRPDQREAVASVSVSDPP
jgi:hypothetical protein